MKSLYALILFFALVCEVAISQPAPPSDPPGPEPSRTEEDAVLAVVLELFDGYRAADSSRVSATFSNNGVMQRIAVQDGKSVVTPTASLSRFTAYVGSGLTQKHDEPLWDTTVHVDGDLASVWTRYAFYLEGKFHHCGVENFLLHKENGSWKIFHLVDTSETENCDIPEAIKAKSEF